jgi:hypothetical protein
MLASGGGSLGAPSPSPPSMAPMAPTAPPPRFTAAVAATAAVSIGACVWRQCRASRGAPPPDRVSAESAEGSSSCEERRTPLVRRVATSDAPAAQQTVACVRWGAATGDIPETAAMAAAAAAAGAAKRGGCCRLRPRVDARFLHERFIATGLPVLLRCAWHATPSFMARPP